MLSNVQELDNLLDVLNQETILDLTFDQCIQKFTRNFTKPKTSTYLPPCTYTVSLILEIWNPHLTRLGLAFVVRQ